MRAKWILLAKIQLMGLLGFNRARKTDDPSVRRKAIGGAVAFAIVSLIMLAYITLFAIVFCGLGLTEAVPATAIALAAVITFFFSLLQGSSMLFALKDYDAVMSLPVSRRAVIGSRLLVSYLVNLLFCLGVMIPVTAVYFVFAGFSFGALATIFAATLSAPLLPVVVATALSTLLTALTAGLRFKGLLQGILGLLMLVAIFLLSFSLSFAMQTDATGNLTAAADVLAQYIYPPAQWITLALSGEGVWGIFAFIGVSLAAAALFVLFIAPFYSKINAALLNHGARVAYKKGDIKSSSAFFSLLRKEFKKLFSSSSYLMNGVAGTLLLIIAGVALLFVDAKSVIDLLISESEAEAPFLVEVLENRLPYMAAGLLIVFTGMSCPAASALSLEGSSRGQLFAMPVSTRTIFLAKSTPTFLLNAIGSLFVSAVLCAKLGTSADGWTIMLGTAVVFSAFTGIFGIYLNYKFPKYDWKTEAAVVKQSAPVTIFTLGAMLLGFAVCALSVLGWYAVVAVDAVCIVLCVTLIAHFGKLHLYV